MAGASMLAPARKGTEKYGLFLKRLQFTTRGECLLWILAARQDNAQRGTRTGALPVCNKNLGECRAGVRDRNGCQFPALALPGDERLIADTVSAGKSHGAQAAAIEGVQ
jgi:hypothetical protein